VLDHILVTLEPQQACQTRELMPDMIVVLKVVLETPLIFESAETKVAEDVMTQRVVDMVFKTVSIFEDARTKVAVVLMVLRLFHVALECNLGVELLVAHTTPVLMRVVGLVASRRCSWRVRCY
jgi:hypothetical protein